MAFAKTNQVSGNFVTLSRESNDLEESVIIVDPGKSMSCATEKILQAHGIEVKVISEEKSALHEISTQWRGILVAHFNTSAGGGLELLKKVRQIDPDLPVLIILGHGDIPLVVSAMRMGAYDVIEKPISNPDIVKIILGALEKRRLVLEKRDLRSGVGRNEKFISFVRGRSSHLDSLFETVRRAAEMDAEVLIAGEMGTGKKMIARCLHDQSPRRHNNFVAVNCSAIPEETLESDFFGHEAGAFPGARHRRIGKLEYAEGGTLFLEKIDCLPLRLQERLLRVLQEGIIERLGSNEPVPIDIRVIASTKEDLKKASEEGRFRKDLFYRLNVISIDLPSLREHRGDIPILFQHFVHQACSQYHRPPPLITSEIYQKILMQDWPGNVHELKNAAERLSLGFALDLLSSGNPSKLIGSTGQSRREEKPLVDKINAFEKTLLVQELTRTRGNVKQAYSTLGLPRKTFYDKMTKHGLKRKNFVEPQPIRHETAVYE